MYCIYLDILQEIRIIDSLSIKNALDNIFYYFSVIYCFEYINSKRKSSQNRGIIKRAKTSKRGQNNNILQLLIISELPEMLPAACILETKAMLMTFSILRSLSGVISKNSSQGKCSVQLKEPSGTWLSHISTRQHPDTAGWTPLCKCQGTELMVSVTAVMKPSQAQGTACFMARQHHRLEVGMSQTHCLVSHVSPPLDRREGA